MISVLADGEPKRECKQPQTRLFSYLICLLVQPAHAGYGDAGLRRIDEIDASGDRSARRQHLPSSDIADIDGRPWGAAHSVSPEMLYCEAL